MPQYEKQRYTKDGRPRARLHLVGPHRTRRITLGPTVTVLGILFFIGKKVYDRYCVLTPQQEFLRKVHISPYGCLGTTLTLQDSLVRKAPLPDEDTVVVDQTEPAYVRRGTSTAVGASLSIYNWLGITGQMFPKEVQLAVGKVGDSKVHAYDGKRVVHVIAPDFRIGQWSEREATMELARAYRNVLHEFVVSEARTIRLVPISSGLYSGPLYDQMPRITQDALASGYDQLHPFDKRELLDDNHKIELCIFMNREWDMYKKVFKNLTPPEKLGAIEDRAKINEATSPQ